MLNALITVITVFFFISWLSKFKVTTTIKKDDPECIYLTTLKSPVSLYNINQKLNFFFAHKGHMGEMWFSLVIAFIHVVYKDRARGSVCVSVRPAEGGASEFRSEYVVIKNLLYLHVPHPACNPGFTVMLII